MIAVGTTVVRALQSQLTEAGTSNARTDRRGHQPDTADCIDGPHRAARARSSHLPCCWPSGYENVRQAYPAASGVAMARVHGLHLILPELNHAQLACTA
jgi:hypothetical protein